MFFSDFRKMVPNRCDSSAALLAASYLVIKFDDLGVKAEAPEVVAPSLHWHGVAMVIPSTSDVAESFRSPRGLRCMRRPWHAHRNVRTFRYRCRKPACLASRSDALGVAKLGGRLCWGEGGGSTYETISFPGYNDHFTFPAPAFRLPS